MKIIGYVLVGYLVLMAVDDFSPATLGNTVASLPDPATMVGLSAATAGLANLALAGAVWYFVL